MATGDRASIEATRALPRVAIAVPSGDMVHAGFAMALAELCHASHFLPLHLVSVKSSIVAVARNNGVEEARKCGADYLFFLDSDMVFPPTTLVRLLRHRQDIVGATYVKRVPPFELIGKACDPQPDAAPSGLAAMELIPTGCLLIRMSVFDHLRKPYFHFRADMVNGVLTGEDFVFCEDARAAGFSIWCDTLLSQELGHIGQKIYRLGDHIGG